LTDSGSALTGIQPYFKLKKIIKTMNSVLDEIRTFADSIRVRYESPIEFPEPNFRLGLAERAGQPTRQFKHLHQMCMGHVEHLAISGEIKLLSLIDGYLMAATSGVVIGPFLFARTIVEQCAFMNELNRRLLEIARKPQKNWMSKGEEFFSVVVRFRFATGDKKLQKNMEAEGFPKKLLKPVNVMTCIDSLASNPALNTLGESYDKFCDFVHHNCQSHYTASSGCQGPG